MHSVTNNSKAEQGIWTDGGLVAVGPGETKNIEIRADYLERAQSLSFLKVSDSSDEADSLEGKTVAELRELAEADEIDIGDATKKADIIAAIELAREG